MLRLDLFERNTQGFRPTQDALALVQSAEAVEKAAKALDAQATSLASAKTRTIRMTAVTDAFNPKLSSILENFVESYGRNVGFDLIPNDDTVDIASGDADVAIRWTNNKIDEPSLICRRLATVGLSMFASNSYAAKSTLPQATTNMGGHKCLAWGGKLADDKMNTWLLQHIQPDQIAMTRQDFKAMETAIQMGAGIGILLTRFMKTDDTLVRCFDLPNDIGPSVWLLVNPTAYRRPEVKAFTAFFAPRYSALIRDT